MGEIFGVGKFQIFFGVLEIPDILGGERSKLGPSLHMKKKWGLYADWFICYRRCCEPMYCVDVLSTWKDSLEKVSSLCHL